jgi:hypothetical protein
MNIRLLFDGLTVKIGRIHFFGKFGEESHMAALELLAEDLVLDSMLAESPRRLPRRRVRNPTNRRRETDRSAARIARRIAKDANRWAFDAATLERIAWLVGFVIQTPNGGWGKLTNSVGQCRDLDEVVPQLLQDFADPAATEAARAQMVADLAMLHALCTGEAVNWTAPD